MLISSCNNYNNPAIATMKGIDNNRPIDGNDTTFRLKYTTGIRAIVEDKNGNIWFGSHQEGAALFDGQAFTYFTIEDGLTHNQIRTIQEDLNGKIWFESALGLSYYDGGKIIASIKKDYSDKNNWKKEDKDLWFKGDEIHGYNKTEGLPGVYSYDGQKLSYHVFPLGDSVDVDAHAVSTAAIKAKNGTLWFGTYAAAIGFDGKSFTILNKESMGLKEYPKHIGIRALFEDSKGNLWIGDNGIGVFLYDGTSILNFTEKHHLRKGDREGNSLHRIFSIAEDANGNIWFGTIESGVWRFNPKSEEFRNFTKKDGLESNHIWTIIRNKQGEMLFGAADPSGVYKFNGKSFDRIF